MKEAISNCAIIILAAGSSARLGSAKQLLPYKGKTLLVHAVDTALETGCPSVFVVLGSNIKLMKNEVKDKPVIVIENSGWQDGMASSISCALESITSSILKPESIILMVCDQPYVSSSLLLSLLEKRKETGMPIVACSYENSIGTPALFHKIFFQSLLQLKGDKGAKKLIYDNPEKVAVVLFPDGITDIDTTEDYNILKNKNDC